MVKSKLDDSINYPEIKSLETEDQEYDADLFEAEILGVDSIIAIGQAKYTFIDNNIIYYPVYIIKDERVDSQIGVYEIFSDMQPSILDEDGDIDITRLGPLLMYQFVTEKFLGNESEKSSQNGDVSDQEESDSDEELEESDQEEKSSEPADDDADDDADDVNFSFSPLKTQDTQQAKIERAAYKKTSREPWPQTFMKNKNYGIVDNEGGGDCLFAAIRDGLARSGVETSVAELREKLANEATEDIFQGYKTMYDMVVSEVTQADTEMKEMTKINKELAKRGKRVRDKEVLKDIITKGKENKEKYDIAKRERKYAKEMLAEYQFMAGIDSLEKFKAKIKTCTFWGETWAISTLERVMNIKLILFSKEAFAKKDIDNVILCGQLNDTILEERGVFEPSHYLMLEFMGYHYTLVTYKDRGSFTFNEIPYDVKLKIVSKCLEKHAGPFYLIPEFRNFLQQLNMDTSDGESSNPSGESKSGIDENIGIYDDSTIFQFYSKSAHKLPGKGAGEKIKETDRNKYSELSSNDHWRKKLSNFWIEPFELDGHTWSSVEHYYQASKFKENNPAFYLSFSLDMNPEAELSKNAAMAKGVGGKSGKFKGKMVRQKDIKLDPTFFSGRHNTEMKLAQQAKFSQNEYLRDLLLATHDAKLVHFVRGAKPIVFSELMEIRNEMQNK